MLRFWTNKILERRFFCPECSAITSHDILAREPFSVRGEIPSGIALVCRCKVCENFFVAFSQELFFGASSAGSDYAKLLSRNRLSPGDWLFVDGMIRPGKISAIYKTPSEEVVVLDAGEKEQKRFSRPLMTNFDESAPIGYRLLPAQSGIALLGDPVYHVIRKAFGRVVGRVMDGNLEKLAIQLETGKIIFITLAESDQRLPDDVLLKSLTDGLGRAYPALCSNIKLNVVHAVAYVYGYVTRFPDRERLLNFVRAMKCFRGAVDLVSVRLAGSPVSDSDLELRAQRMLEDDGSPLFNYTVSVTKGELKVNACFLSGQDVSKIKSRLGDIEGLHNVVLELEKIPLPSAQMQQQAIKLFQGLKMNARFSHCNLRVFPLDDGIIVEGRVNNVLQKSLVNFTAIRGMKGIKILTRLRVENI